MNIGVLLIATNRYVDFVGQVVDSIMESFMPTEERRIFLFTDCELPFKEEINIIPIEHEPWPMIPLRQFSLFRDHRNRFHGLDFLFYLDVDMRIVDTVSTEILPDSKTGLVGTLHPGFYRDGKNGTFETRPTSAAYVCPGSDSHYYCGAFFGGERQAFLRMSERIAEGIDRDLKSNIIAIWHDESYLNRYFDDVLPKILPPSFCYPESWTLPFPKIILALDKDHAAIRNEDNSQ